MIFWRQSSRTPLGGVPLPTRHTPSMAGSHPQPERQPHFCHFGNTGQTTTIARRSTNNQANHMFRWMRNVKPMNVLSDLTIKSSKGIITYEYQKRWSKQYFSKYNINLSTKKILYKYKTQKNKIFSSLVV